MAKEMELMSKSSEGEACSFDVNDVFYQRLLSDIQSAISTLPDGAYTLELVSSTFEAFAAAFAAFLINYLYWKKVDKKKNANRRLRKIIDTSEKLKKVASIYWASDYSSSSGQRSAIQEIDIVDLHKKLVKFERNYKLEHNQKEILDGFTREIYDVVTGGEFKSKDRKSDVKRVKKIADLCTSFQLDFDSYME